MTTITRRATTKQTGPCVPGVACHCPTAYARCAVVAQLEKTRAKFPNIEFDSRRFNWTGCEGFADASDLGFRAGALPEIIMITSSKTGETLRFWAGAPVTRDGDVLWTPFVTVVQGNYITVKIYND